jgi:hypothetical protein
VSLQTEIASLATGARALAAALFAVILTACGAPSQRAGDVVHLFKPQTEKLREVAANLCSQLASSDSAPSLKKVKLTEGDCLKVDVNSRELTSAAALDFTNVEQKILQTGSAAGGSTASGPGVLYLQTRGQVWLNRPMLQLAQRLVAAAREAQATGGSSLLPNMNTSAAQNDIVKVSFKEIKKTEIDATGKHITAAVELTGKGVVAVNNVITTEGHIFDDSLAFEINSREDRTFEQSIFQRMNAIVLVIPYGNDVYIDMVMDLYVHSLGADKLLTEQISQTLSTSIKASLDALRKLE